MHVAGLFQSAHSRITLLEKLSVLHLDSQSSTLLFCGEDFTIILDWKTRNTRKSSQEGDHDTECRHQHDHKLLDQRLIAILAACVSAHKGQVPVYTMNSPEEWRSWWALLAALPYWANLYSWQRRLGALQCQLLVWILHYCGFSLQDRQEIFRSISYQKLIDQ